MTQRIVHFFQKVKTNKMAMNYIWVFLGQNIGTVFSMLSLIITLRLISTLEYGSLVVIQTYSLLISNLFGFRTFNGLIKYVTESETNGDYLSAKQYVNTAFAMDVIAGVVAFVLGIILLNPIVELMEWDASMMKMVFYYLPIVIFLPIINGAPVGVLRKTNCFKHVNIVHAIVLGAQMFVLAILWVLKINCMVIVLLVFELTEVFESLALIGLAYVKLNSIEQYKGFQKAGIKKDVSFIKYNLFFGLTTAVDQILGNVSTLLINKFIGNFATAYIKVITRICGVISKLASPIGQIFYPELCEWVARKKYRKAYQVSMRFFVAISCTGIGVVVLMMLTYDWWIVLFDAAMIDTKWQSFLYFLYTIMSTSMICITQLTFAMNLVKKNLQLVTVFNVVYLILLIPAIKAYGIYGYLLLQLGQLLCVALGKTILLRRTVDKLE